ncbi:hypothetical protein ANCCAN_26678 [Ancylostoma caninum]|uniref:Uncharacterized protein n=1 Tax=Ancylostoma caninum TaxID=29170 RepID=A0A368F650_ANCCA|nr:hypothetical protein ANCCAN_26678 [Ancylostoma caninum]
MSLLVSVYICTPKSFSNRPPKYSKLTPPSRTPAPPTAGRIDAAKDKGSVGKMTAKPDPQLAKTQECDAMPEQVNVKVSKRTTRTDAAAKDKDVFEFQKKAVDDGIVLHPSCVKHMGNIDEIALVSPLLKKQVRNIYSFIYLCHQSEKKMGIP